MTVWTPDPARAARSRMHAMHERFDTSDFETLHALSIRQPGRFWQAVWDECGVIGEPGDVGFDEGDGTMRGARFFTDGQLNFAENLVRPSSEQSDEGGDALAIVGTDETGRRRELTRRELHDLVARTAAAMRAEGVQPGDRVAAWMANIPETVAIMLAAASIGAVFSSTSPDFGVAGVVDRFGQIEPVLLFAVDGYQYGGKRFDCTARLGEIAAALPSVRRVVVVRHLDEGSLPDGAVAFDEW
ncbi:MAG TPA: AMP-binding protein, partial [Acidimicrobiia bacterium]